MHERFCGTESSRDFSSSHSLSHTHACTSFCWCSAWTICAAVPLVADVAATRDENVVGPFAEYRSEVGIQAENLSKTTETSAYPVDAERILHADERLEKSPWEMRICRRPGPMPPNTRYCVKTYWPASLQAATFGATRVSWCVESK